MRATPAYGKEHWFGILDSYGQDSLLEFIAEGNLPVEWAAANEIPPLFLREWILERVDPKRLQIALESFAEFCAVRSTLVLEILPESPHEAAVQKSMSEAWRWKAERTNPKQWMPPKGTGVALPAVNIQLNLGGVKPPAALGRAAMPTIELSADPAPAEVLPDDEYGEDE